MKDKVNKDPLERLNDLEWHLFQLAKDWQEHEQQPEIYKDIAGRLRVLVADKKHKNRLLITLMDEYNFCFEVRFDHEIQLVTDETRVSMPFPEYAEKGLAVFILPKRYSHNDLVRDVAQQTGIDHEGRAIDGTLDQMRQARFNGQYGHAYPLANFCATTLRAGLSFLEFMRENHCYELRHFKLLDGRIEPVTVHSRSATFPQARARKISAKNGELPIKLEAQFTHPHDDWATNNNTYAWELACEGIIVSVRKNPPNVFSVRVSRETSNDFVEFVGAVTITSGNYVQFGIELEKKDVRLFVFDKLAQSKQLPATSSQ